jgi:hypothetical protein
MHRLPGEELPLQAAVDIGQTAAVPMNVRWDLMAKLRDRQLRGRPKGDLGKYEFRISVCRQERHWRVCLRSGDRVISIGPPINVALALDARRYGQDLVEERIVQAMLVAERQSPGAHARSRRSARVARRATSET